MRKNIFSALTFSAAIFIFSATSAQQTKEKQTFTSDPNVTMQKGSTTVSPTSANSNKQTSQSNQTSATPKEVGVKINDWMKTNVGTDEMQGVRINAASSNLISSLRDIRNNVTDIELRKSQVQQVMQNFNTQLKSVLKPEQFEIYKSKRPDLIKNFNEMKDESVNENE